MPEKRGVMIGFFLPISLANSIALEDGEDPEELHVTVLYLGKELEEEQVTKVKKITSHLANRIKPIQGEITGHGRFPATEHSDGKDVRVRLVSIPRLEALREELIFKLRLEGIEPVLNFGYTPHITLKYADPSEKDPLPSSTSIPFSFTTLTVASGGIHYDYVLTGKEIIKTKSFTVTSVKKGINGKGFADLLTDDMKNTCSISYDYRTTSLFKGERITWKNSQGFVLNADGEFVDQFTKIGYSFNPVDEIESNVYLFSDVLSPISPVFEKEEIEKLKEISVPIRTEFSKFDEEKRWAFGWASVVLEKDTLVVDSHGHVISENELEEAAYKFVLNARVGGVMHEREGEDPVQVGLLIESMMFTKEKQAVLGIDLEKSGWWVGFYVTNDEVWKLVKEGLLSEFSIHGSGKSTPILTFD